MGKCTVCGENLISVPEHPSPDSECKWCKIKRLEGEVARLTSERDEARQWVRDLHSGMYINCVYCGHRYGPKDKVPESMADVLKAHVEQCPKHPMSALKKECEELREQLNKLNRAAHGGGAG